MKSLREIVAEIESRRPRLQCNCDLDNWQPEPDTKHSWVCNIHKEAKRMFNQHPHPSQGEKGTQ